MILKQLLENVEYELIQGSTDIEITGIVNDSRKIKDGCVFPCIRGVSFDGHKFAAEVAQKGAAAIIAEEKVDVPENVTLVVTRNTRIAMARMAAAWFGYPAKKMKMIGITGTKGKTTTTYIVKGMLESAGIRTGLIGTIETLIGTTKIPSANTTPESLVLQEYLARMVKEGCKAVVMEVSSQALMMHRVEGITFDIGVFSNISADHIGPGEHSSFEEYMDCKSKLFRMCKVGIFNGDDIHLGRILEGHTCEVETYGLKQTDDLYADNICLVSRPGYLGTSFQVKGNMEFKAETDIPGKFSVYNALCAIAICRHFGVDTKQLKKALREVKVRGRVEMVKVSDDFIFLIDYAHNAMALE
ncbi:MAG: UDP-N-acetylmuramyl-tripeptide synthetase, partial [Lachnospiraceae bacterium]|nr:UDP-N-acetylmuramyl-tripeptide synthetase [Lachnospiraceae bacterium]